MVTILMILATLATPCLLKTKVIYDVIVSVHDVINKNLSRDSNYIVDVIIIPTFFCPVQTLCNQVPRASSLFDVNAKK